MQAKAKIFIKNSAYLSQADGITKIYDIMISKILILQLSRNPKRLRVSRISRSFVSRL